MYGSWEDQVVTPKSPETSWDSEGFLVAFLNLLDSAGSVCTNFVEVPGLWSAQVPHDCPGRSTGFPRGRNTHPHGGRSGKGIHSPARAWPKSQPKPLQCWTPNVGIYTYGGFHKLGVPQNLWFIMENPIKMDDLEVPPFQEETSIFGTIFWAVSNVHCMRGMGWQ